VFFPVDIRDYAKTGRQVEEARQEPVRVAIFVEVDAPDVLVDFVQKAFHPYTPNAKVDVEVAEAGTRLIADPTTDVVIGVVGSGATGIAHSLDLARERAIPTVAMAIGDEAREIANVLGSPYRDTLAASEADELVEDELGDWLVDRLPGKRAALAYNFQFMRRAVAVDAVKNTAWQNGVIGVVAFFPGADMPLMTANQAKMAMQIAAAYGETIGLERLKELGVVVGGAFVFRTVARQAAGFVPGFGWAIKGGIGAAGTLAMGYGIIEYFEQDVDLSGVRRRFDKLKAELDERTSSRRGRKAEIIEAEIEVLDDQQLAAGVLPAGDQDAPDTHVDSGEQAISGE
jgi:uncharacterized protein (DUF697 family)